ncbi:hypothetical protein SLEP1_g45191 [Rubroshorea leprosula]|uniref:Uncharacterized protein n=1 Tax=Rubroshorea leprosula TaxID=152421 RepID=A0AAV5LIA3_9ROSI|nr:hypothetical protein SLEP1_g45191 [Rubroshorea leprosula]
MEPRHGFLKPKCGFLEPRHAGLKLGAGSSNLGAESTPGFRTQGLGLSRTRLGFFFCFFVGCSHAWLSWYEI